MLTYKMDSVLILASIMLHVSLSTPESLLDFHSPGPWRFPEPKPTFAPSSRYSQGLRALVCAVRSSVPLRLGLVVPYYLVSSLLLFGKFKTTYF